MSLVVRMSRSALPFCEDVCGHERRNDTPCVDKKSHNELVRNSPPLSHYRHFVEVLNWFSTKAKKH